MIECMNKLMNIHPLIYTSSDHRSLARLKPGARNSIQAPGVREPGTWAVFCSLPRWLSRRLDWWWICLSCNWHCHMGMLVSKMGALPVNMHAPEWPFLHAFYYQSENASYTIIFQLLSGYEVIHLWPVFWQNMLNYHL